MDRAGLLALTPSVRLGQKPKGTMNPEWLRQLYAEVITADDRQVLDEALRSAEGKDSGIRFLRQTEHGGVSTTSGGGPASGEAAGRRWSTVARARGAEVDGGQVERLAGDLGSGQAGATARRRGPRPPVPPGGAEPTEGDSESIDPRGGRRRGAWRGRRRSGGGAEGGLARRKQGTPAGPAETATEENAFPMRSAGTISQQLTCYAAAQALLPGAHLHAHLLKSGFLASFRNHLISFYSKCRRPCCARRVFDEVPEPCHVSWSSLVTAYSNNGLPWSAIQAFHAMRAGGICCNEFALPVVLKCVPDARLGAQVHAMVVATGFDNDVFVANALVAMYGGFGFMDDARRVFDEAGSERNAVSWNGLMTAYVKNDQCGDAIQVFGEMVWSGIQPTEFGFSCVVNACTGSRNLEAGRQVHAMVVRTGYDKDVFTANALVDIILKACAGADAFDLGRQVHGFMIKADADSDDYIGVGLVDMYAKHHFLDDARKEGLGVNRTTLAAVLKSTASLEAVSATRQCDHGEGAIKLFMEMLRKGLEPDPFVLSSLLNACASLSAYEQGKQVHAHLIKRQFMSDVFAGNALVYTYAKCGSIEDAELAFSSLPERGVVSWSAMIGGLAQHGHGKKALELFRRMVDEGIDPNHITMTSVLCACNHAGLVDEAKRYFNSMKEMFGIDRTEEHYSCMIDLLGRAGKLDDAMELVNSMPFQANASVWGALLGASRVHKDPELGRLAAEKLFSLEPEKSGMWDEVAKVRKLMKDSNIKKEPAMSWVEVKDKVDSDQMKNSMILETDANTVAGKVATNAVDGSTPFSEQTISQDLAAARELGAPSRSLLKCLFFERCIRIEIG
ncbi:hypothetical protein E2562_031917 [Oryza meyeriana var. granulata]|uniref:Pentatricopeptide repeat-containing protein n=1 Tax=Oryza meyeriana var. granulata TaxID=110450 RepID=A0A6G1DRT9_9ORYZ|nr:hypothetical protein E2562_031917 [Oryza meyeriana var. granulata]